MNKTTRKNVITALCLVGALASVTYFVLGAQATEAAGIMEPTQVRESTNSTQDNSVWQSLQTMIQTSERTLFNETFWVESLYGIQGARY